MFNIRIRKTSANIVRHQRTVIRKILAVFLSENIYTSRKQGRACASAGACRAPASNPTTWSVGDWLAWETCNFDFFWLWSNRLRIFRKMFQVGNYRECLERTWRGTNLSFQNLRRRPDSILDDWTSLLSWEKIGLLIGWIRISKKYSNFWY